MIWESILTELLEGAGRVRAYRAGEWLAGEPRVIRRILSGRITVHARWADREEAIGDYGEGNWLGIRSALHPDTPPALHWRAQTDAECLEFAWSDIRQRMQEPRVRAALEHLARVRLFAAIMAGHPLFACLDRATRKRLFNNAGQRMLAPGQTLVCQGGEQSPLYLIVAGDVRIVRNGRTVARRGSGDVVGELSCFGVRNAPVADVIADTLTEVIEFRNEDVMDAARGSGAFQRQLADMCRQRLNTRD